ncbi:MULTISPECIES: hypothetical protein [unclassified Okeania]|uniref:hypothetical protein n=1 Tax=unclassified Okeania TaxID=2634635 RepID=UPI0013B90067|nr:MULTISPECIES: hypothetical protein [unclassified Okeania]NES78284.1 hypothetical protein [Okeania sp. SIO1H4]NET21624.1 hypothetical protein [Okeania sp. SIO1H5]NET94973.1 hypothetical protein [Okeania sp. SIO1H2]
MANNLLIVFGGTTQSEPQTIFSCQDLSTASVDVLQINLLTIEPNVSFISINNNNKDTYFLSQLDGNWLEGTPTGTLRNLQVKLLLQENDVLKALKTTIEKVNWSHANYTNDSDAKGMQKETFDSFSQVSQQLIVDFLEWTNNQGNDYQNVFILAHSRGCALAIQSLSKSNVTELSDNLLTQKLKRIVLLDPVSKNAGKSLSWFSNEEGVDEKIITANAKIVELLSKKNKEIHIIVKSVKKTMNYECYADRLVGTKRGGCYTTFSPIDMKNVYVHIAAMAHEGMLGKRFRDNFKNYRKIIDNNWNEIFWNDKKVDFTQMRNSDALKTYKNGEKSVSTIVKEVSSSTNDYFQNFNAFSNEKALLDRQRAFVHCLAQKVQPLS